MLYMLTLSYHRNYRTTGSNTQKHLHDGLLWLVTRRVFGAGRYKGRCRSWQKLLKELSAGGKTRMVALMHCATMLSGRSLGQVLIGWGLVSIRECVDSPCEVTLESTVGLCREVGLRLECQAQVCLCAVDWKARRHGAALCKAVLEGCL